MIKNLKIKNIIFIITDTLRAQSIGLYQSNGNFTPNINKLGREAVVFKNAYASITKTDPSITSIMTGKYPAVVGLVNHGRNIQKTEEENASKNIFLAELLKKNGYKTAAIDWLDRWHKIGFDHYSGKINKDLSSVNLVIDKLPLFFYARVIDKLLVKFLKRDFILRFYYSFFQNPIIPYDPGNKVIDSAINILRKYSSEKTKKLFLYIHLWDAHLPHTKSRGLISYLLDSTLDTYNAEVRFLDGEIGRLLKYLKSTKQIDNSLIILTSDHGENFQDHDRPFNHEGLYDDVVKIPLIIRHKSLTPKTTSSLVQHIDIFPTILDFLGIKIPKDINGKSLLPILNSSKKEIRDKAYFEDIIFRRLKFTKKVTRRRGLKMSNYKYIQTLEGRGEGLYKTFPSKNIKVVKEELFDLKLDKMERQNLLHKKGIVVKRLRNQLNSFIFSLSKNSINGDLRNKINKSIQKINLGISKAGSQDIAIAWKGGKDTTSMMHIIKTIYGKIPFKVFFNDTTLEFKETYKFIEKMKKLWNLDLIVLKHDEEELKAYHKEKDFDKKKELANLMKINSIKRAVKKYKIGAFMLGIRRDENPARKNVKYFSKRVDHMRIHPMLDWTEKDIWEYINHFGIPYNDLYDKGYRSVGEKPFTKPASPEESERSGRERDKEQLMERLRKMGYW